MNKLIAVAIALIAVYFVFIQGRSFEKDLYFDGATYSHVEKMRGGEITNHFYTPNGEDFSTAESFVQIVEISDAMRATDWQDSLKPLHGQYQLAPVSSEALELAGDFEKSGLFFRSYAARIEVDGADHMAFYVTASREYDAQTRSDKMDIINRLKRIGADFD